MLQSLCKPPMSLALPFVFVFLLGACLGSFLNVCIARLPLEKSLVWPSSRCGHCLQAIRWYDNIPLVSYWLLRGRCRVCRRSFSPRYFFVELFTGLGLVGLYYVEVVANVHHLNPRMPSMLTAVTFGQGFYFTWFDVGRVAIFLFHAVLFCFLLAAAFCDLAEQAVPLSLTVTGTIVGLIGATLFPWPWPYAPHDIVNFRSSVPPVAGLYAWPVWYPLPAWLRPGGNWQTGLATGLAGAFAGTMLVRAVRFLFGLGAGAAYAEEEVPRPPEQHPRWIGGRAWAWVQGVGGKALGLGDADLMMMAGAFLGWQMVIVAFFVSALPGLVFGLGALVLRGNRPMPFVPALALGVVVTWLGWRWIGDPYQVVFFNGLFLSFVVVIGCVGMLAAAFVIRVMRALRGA